MSEEVSLDEWPAEHFIEAVETLENPTTAEVVVEVGCDGRTARIRLNELFEAGELEREDFGFAKRWSVPE